MEFRLVGVVGAGVMGRGVAQNLSETGHQVVLVDVVSGQLEQARDAIRSAVRMNAMFRKKPNMEGPDAVLSRIRFTQDYSELATADFVIENVVEKVDVKQAVYGQLDRICREDCVFAANTSAIAITRIASWTARASQVVGTHFMNPVPLKSMVEVIRSPHTSDATLQRTRALLAEMGKECIVVNDMPGFVSNRVLMLTINEAIFLVQDGVSTVEDIDRLFRSCFAHKMGPLETGDLIGLDTVLYSLEVLYESYNDEKFRPCPLLRKMVEEGLHGRKTGRGFHSYDEGGRASAI
ncbi:MAG TPA: 3-hydroxyacyl-CoA dehydrogenase family protein [Vicinamibacterales bacterium]|nr:3-hydroxyacyl-CoA dehydrogenase family protein [Vicinamibacterales bacterium]